MNKTIWTLFAIVRVAAVGGGGYWYGTQAGAARSATATSGQASSAQAQGKGGAGGTPQAITVEAINVIPVADAAEASSRWVRCAPTIGDVAPGGYGRIVEFLFKEGQQVSKGAVLVRLDDSVTKADADQARANLWLAKSKSERTAELHQKGFVSAQAKDDAEGGMRVAQATLQSAEARLAKMEIRAPFSGVIGLRQVSVGDYVKDGQDMVNLEAIESLKVDFKVPETFLRQVQVGQTMQLTLDAIPARRTKARCWRSTRWSTRPGARS
jgi:membrane fusion protein (multidrug efflux system)